MIIFVSFFLFFFFLGLDMIQIIRKVRELRGLDVDMRIGVHSGTIISGIIGANKWQYDVWSRDVVIANKMEQTGKAGKVHVTEQTLNLLDISDYNCTPVESVNNDTLNKYKIKTYLLTASQSSPASAGGITNLRDGESAEVRNNVLPSNHIQYSSFFFFFLNQ